MFIIGTTNFGSISAPEGVTGPLTGNVTGNVVGNVTGDVEGNSSGDFKVLAAINLGTAALTMTAAQALNTRLEVSTGHATNAIIVPVAMPGKLYVVVNADSGAAALIKVAGGSAITIAASKTAMVQVNNAGSEVTRISSDI